jgi:hypothetical protein
MRQNSDKIATKQLRKIGTKYEQNTNKNSTKNRRGVPLPIVAKKRLELTHRHIP